MDRCLKSSAPAAVAATLLLWATAVLLPQQAEAVTAVTEWESGYATFYGGAPDGMDPNSPSYGTSVGSCGFGLLDKNEYPYWSVGALATANHFFQEEPLKGCGECFEVQCLENGPLGDKPGSCQYDPNNRTIVIMITDSCPECGSNHLDLQALTWEKIANPSPSGGRINVQYRRVECAPPSDLVVNVDSNEGGDRWIRLTIQKAGGPAGVKQVQVRSAGTSDWTSLNNLWGGTWEIGQQPQPPIDVKVIANNGAEVVQEDAIPYDRQTGVLQTGVQFKITDPSDVQPIGDNVDVSRDTVQLGGNASDPTVQAFEGPPEDAVNATASAGGEGGSGGSGNGNSSAPSNSTSSGSSPPFLPPPPPGSNSINISSPSPTPTPSSSPSPSPSPPPSSGSGNSSTPSTVPPPSGTSNSSSPSSSRSSKPTNPSPPPSGNSTSPLPPAPSHNGTSPSRSTPTAGNNTKPAPGPRPAPSHSPARPRLPSTPAPPAKVSRPANSSSAAPAHRSEDTGGASSGECACENNKPYSIFNCEAAKAAGQCNAWWLRAGLYCQKLCGNCADGCASRMSLEDSSASGGGEIWSASPAPGKGSPRTLPPAKTTDSAAGTHDGRVFGR